MNRQCIKFTRLIFCLSAISVALHAQATAARPRLVCLFLDLNSLDAAEQIKAREGAIQFVEQVAAPSDVVEIMTYTSRLNVIQDFTTDRDSLVAALHAIAPANPGSSATSNAAANVSARFQALQDAVSSLSRFPTKRLWFIFPASRQTPASTTNSRLPSKTRSPPPSAPTSAFTRRVRPACSLSELTQ